VLVVSCSGHATIFFKSLQNGLTQTLKLWSLCPGHFCGMDGNRFIILLHFSSINKACDRLRPLLFIMPAPCSFFIIGLSIKPNIIKISHIQLK
jgi:hypothetical protein